MGAGGDGLPDFALSAAAAVSCPTPGGSRPNKAELKVWLNQLDARLDALTLEGPARAERKALLLTLQGLHERVVRLPAPDPPVAPLAAPPAAPPTARRAAKESPPPPPPPPAGLLAWLTPARAAALVCLSGVAFAIWAREQ
jgi:hypothetical protein